MNIDSATLDLLGFRPTGAGEVMLSGPAEELFESWNLFLQRLLRPLYAESVRAGLFLDRQVLETTGYLEHFPQHVIRATSLVESAADRRYMTPAACFHVYPSLAGNAIDGVPHSILIEARCVRHECGEWRFPFRLAAFQMVELVVVGSCEAVSDVHDRASEFVHGAFAGLGLNGRFAPATDAFFLGNDDGARLMQKLKGLKREYLVACAGEDLAIASINRHEDYFGQRFEILAGDAPAHSCCIAFGLERLTACGLFLWGGDRSSWPEELRP